LATAPCPLVTSWGLSAMTCGRLAMIWGELRSGRAPARAGCSRVPRLQAREALHRHTFTEFVPTEALLKRRRSGGKLKTLNLSLEQPASLRDWVGVLSAIGHASRVWAGGPKGRSRRGACTPRAANRASIARLGTGAGVSLTGRARVAWLPRD
jgi:hypothetical protein